MRYIKLIAKKCCVTSETGFLATCHKSWFESSESYILPYTNFGHDLMHHGTKETGSVEDEFKALGCSIWMSDFYSYGNLTESGLKDDFISTLRDGFYCGLEHGHNNVSHAPKHKLTGELRALKEIFDAAYDGMAENLAKEIQGGFYMRDTATDEERAEAMMIEYEEETARIAAWLAENRNNLFGWFAHGFWYAGKVRYRGFQPYQVHQVFRQLNKLEFRNIEEGEILKISYSIANNDVRSWRGFPYEESYY